MEVFITGATGLLGSKLIGKLSNDGRVSKIYALVRSEQKAQGLHDSRVVLLKGDVCLPNFGINEAQLSSLSRVSRFYHLAANIHLGHDEKAATIVNRVNVGGMKHTLDFLCHLPQLEHFIFVSSAYACGDYGGEVPEGWMKRPRRFRNPYEESKWESERLIKDRLTSRFSIVRPSILLDREADLKSTSGYSIYLFASVLQKFSKIGNVKILGDETCSLNFVFVDDLADFLCSLDRSQFCNFVGPNILLKNLLEKINVGLDIESQFSSEGVDGLNRVLKPFLPYMSIKDLIWDQKRDTNLEAEEVLQHIYTYCRMRK